MTKEDIISYLVKEYEVKVEDANPAVDAFLKNGVDFNDGSLEVADVADYVMTTTKYWKKNGDDDV